MILLQVIRSSALLVLVIGFRCADAVIDGQVVAWHTGVNLLSGGRFSIIASFQSIGHWCAGAIVYRNPGTQHQPVFITSKSCKERMFATNSFISNAIYNSPDQEESNTNLFREEVRLNPAFECHDQYCVFTPLDSSLPVPVPSFQLRTPTPADNCRFAGWGKQSRDRPSQEGRFLSHTAMKVTHRYSENSRHCGQRAMVENEMCVRSIGDAVPCDGDEGGPLVCGNEGNLFIGGFMVKTTTVECLTGSKTVFLDAGSIHLTSK